MSFHLRRLQLDSDPTTLTPLIHHNNIRKKRPHSSSPSSTPSNTRPNTPASACTPKRRRHLAPTRTQFHLEALPTEILTHIFSYTISPALPRSSHLIGAKLSGESIYRAYFIRLFSSFEQPKPEPYVVANPRSGHLYRVCRAEAVEAEDAFVRAREKVMMCRWLTAERFVRYREVLLTAERTRLRGICSSATTEQSRASKVEGLDLFLGKDFTLPTYLLRYAEPSKQDSRGFRLLVFLLKTYHIKLNLYTDGFERAKEMFHDAIVARDYFFIYLMIYNGWLDFWREEAYQGLKKIRFDVAMIRFLRRVLQYAGTWVRGGRRPGCMWPAMLEERAASDGVGDVLDESFDSGQFPRLSIHEWFKENAGPEDDWWMQQKKSFKEFAKRQLELETNDNGSDEGDDDDRDHHWFSLEASDRLVRNADNVNDYIDG